MPLQIPDRETTVYWYLGTDDVLARGGQGTADLETPIELVARSRATAPAGIGGEAIFTQLFVSLYRSNNETLTLEFVPIVNGVDKEVIEIALPPVPYPTREVLEIGLVEFYPSFADPQIATVLRGTWFATEFRLVTIGVAESGSDPSTGRLIVEGVELEYEAVTEGRGASNATA